MLQCQPSYESNIGMMIQILGYDAVVNEGAAVDPFLKAVETHDPEKGQFSTWLYHNLALSKTQIRCGKKKPEPLPLDEALEVDGIPQPSQIVEFRDQLNQLSVDAKVLVRCVLSSSPEGKRKRTKFASPCTASAREVRTQLKNHCRESLNWSWPRYWKAVHEIQEMLK